MRKLLDDAGLKAVGGTTRYIIEHESDPEHAFETAQQCLDYIKVL